MVIKLTCAADKVGILKPSEIKTLLDRDSTGEYVLLDVRQPEEYVTGHIPGAVLIPLGELETRYDQLNREKTIVTYCRSGRRSMAAAIVLCGLGFEKIFSMDGGMLNWSYESIPGIPPQEPELIIEQADITDVLLLAIKLEKGSMDFYQAASDKVMSPEAKALFTMLASAENKHINSIYERGAHLPEPISIPPLQKLKAEIASDYMEGGIKISPALSKLDETFNDEQEGIEIALEKEYLSYDFYKHSSSLLEKPEVKLLLHELSLEERRHADLLLQRLSNIIRTKLG